MDALDWLEKFQYANRYIGWYSSPIPAWDRVNRHFIYEDYDKEVQEDSYPFTTEQESMAESMAGCK